MSSNLPSLPSAGAVTGAEVTYVVQAGADAKLTVSAIAAFANSANGTASSKNIGTSGGTVPLLNTANTWSAGQSFGASPVTGSDFIITGGSITGIPAPTNAADAATKSYVDAVVPVQGTGIVVTGRTVAVAASQMIRSIPFPMVGPNALTGGQDMIICVSQAGTLLANGGAPTSRIKVLPTATQTFTLNTINGGTTVTHGTISISTAGVVTWPTFAAVPMAAGDCVELINQATADATFTSACLTLQFQVT